MTTFFFFFEMEWKHYIDPSVKGYSFKNVGRPYDNIFFFFETEWKHYIDP